MYHLLCSAIAEAAAWDEKMIVAREIFAPVHAMAPYTADCEPARTGYGRFIIRTSLGPAKKDPHAKAVPTVEQSA